MEVFIFLCLVVLSVIGLCDLMHYIKLLLLKPSKRVDSTLLIKLSGENDFENLNYILEKFRWQGSNLAKRVVCIFNDTTEKDLIREFKSKICFINEAEIDFKVFGEDYGESGDSRYC